MRQNAIGEFIGRRVVTGDRAPQPGGVQDIQVLVSVDAGAPFAPEELAIGWVGLILKLIHQRLDIVKVVVNTLLNPEVNMRAGIDQLGINLEVVVHVDIARPEELNLTNRAGRGTRLKYGRDIFP